MPPPLNIFLLPPLGNINWSGIAAGRQRFCLKLFSCIYSEKCCQKHVGYICGEYCEKVGLKLKNIFNTAWIPNIQLSKT